MIFPSTEVAGLLVSPAFANGVELSWAGEGHTDIFGDEEPVEVYLTRAEVEALRDVLTEALA